MAGLDEALSIGGRQRSASGYYLFMSMNLSLKPAVHCHPVVSPTPTHIPASTSHFRFKTPWSAQVVQVARGNLPSSPQLLEIDAGSTTVVWPIPEMFHLLADGGPLSGVTSLCLRHNDFTPTRPGSTTAQMRRGWSMYLDFEAVHATTSIAYLEQKHVATMDAQGGLFAGILC